MSGSEDRLRAAVLLPLERASRAEQVARRLRQAVRLGLLDDGERLPSETELAQLLGVSAATVREALGTARSEGLVETRRGRGGGTFVRTPHPPPADAEQRLRAITLDELRDASDVSAGALGSAARLAAQRAGAADLTGLRSVAEEFERTAARPPAGRGSELAAHDARLHLEVAAAAQSPRLVRAVIEWEAAYGDLAWVDATPDEARGAVDDHADLLDALEGRDGPRASAVATGHLEDAAARLAARCLRLRRD